MSTPRLQEALARAHAMQNGRALAPTLSARYLEQSTHLTAPTSVEKYVQSAIGNTDADLVMLDLEDSIPRGNAQALEQGRQNIIDALVRGNWGDKLRFFRPRGFELDPEFADVIAIVGAAGGALDGLIYPKAEDVAQVVALDAQLNLLERDHHLTAGSIRLGLLIESVAAEEVVFPLAHASRRIVSLIFGVLDRPAKSTASRYPRLTLVRPGAPLQLRLAVYENRPDRRQCQANRRHHAEVLRRLALLRHIAILPHLGALGC